jgi:hypothetical protein
MVKRSWLFLIIIFFGQQNIAKPKEGKLLEFGLDIGLAVGKALYNNYLAEQRQKQNLNKLQATGRPRIIKRFGGNQNANLMNQPNLQEMFTILKSNP